MKIEEIQAGDSVIRVPVPQSYSDVMDLVRSDMFRVSGKIPSNCRIIIRMLLRPFGSYLIWFRFASYRPSGFRNLLSLFSRFMRQLCGSRDHIFLTGTTRVGYGLYIGRGWCIAINSDAVIGNNVNLSQFVNIGSNHGTAARICDNVYIGPEVCIVENVVIGQGSNIGAGAVVVKDIPSFSTAVGVPAKVVNGNPDNFINNPWPV